jgi:hypothetical protein
MVFLLLISLADVSATHKNLLRANLLPQDRHLSHFGIMYFTALLDLAVKLERHLLVVSESIPYPINKITGA